MYTRMYIGTKFPTPNYILIMSMMYIGSTVFYPTLIANVYVSENLVISGYTVFSVGTYTLSIKQTYFVRGHSIFRCEIIIKLTLYST